MYVVSGVLLEPPEGPYERYAHTLTWVIDIVPR